MRLIICSVDVSCWDMGVKVCDRLLGSLYLTSCSSGVDGRCSNLRAERLQGITLFTVRYLLYLYIYSMIDPCFCHLGRVRVLLSVLVYVFQHSQCLQSCLFIKLPLKEIDR